MGERSGVGDEEQHTNGDISLVLGRSVYDLYDSKEAELQQFRRSIIKVVGEAVRQRQQCGLASVASYHHPSELASSPSLPAAVEKRLVQGYLSVVVRRDSSPPTTLQVTWDVYPEGIIAKALKQLAPPPDISGAPQGPTSYVLKFHSTKEYLLAARPITQYKTVRLLLCHGKMLELSLVSRRDLYSSLDTFDFKEPSYVHSPTPCDPPTPEDGTAPPSISLWHPSLAGRLRVHVLQASNINCKEAHKAYVRACVCHGAAEVCGVRETQRSAGPRAEWGEWLQFDLPIQEVPRGAKLCLAVCCERQVSDRRRKRERTEEVMLAWGNVNLFDYRGRLVHHKLSVALQPPLKGLEEMLHPLGPTGQSLGVDSAVLEVEFEQRFGQNVTFPDTGQMEDYARYIIKLERGQRKQQDSSRDKEEEAQDPPMTTTTIAQLSRRDPLIPLTAGEQVALWRARQLCPEVPDSLPRLMEAVRWSCRDQVSQLYLLVREWPPVAPETALELLQGTSADPTVRRHAVRLLDRALTDQAFLQYMLQLVQSLKHEPYLHSPLLCLLLRRCLTNAKLGHFLFWHLKAEMEHWPHPLHVPAMLEAYCRGLGPGGLRVLVRQVEAVDKLTQIADHIKDRPDGCKLQKTQVLRELLQETEYSTALQHLPSPLHPAYYLGRLRVSECRVLDSAQRPIWLSWHSPQPLSPTSLPAQNIIFKSGDDLRQDMLCLQVFGIMAQMWTNEGLDLRMVPYTCLATGRDVGMIEVVRNAETVYNIQRSSKLGAIQVDSSQLLKWIRDKNKDLRLEQAIDNFTRSCAGYCVATFVLGIGDRHPSNIMVNQDGLIFHIDFGHILGHFKKKFGIQRERVPFVLTQDFLAVIANGAENPKESHEFQRFQELCGKAYLALRHHYRQLVIFFSQLVSTGMPELQTLENVEYLRKTLAVEVREEEALQYFQSRFHEAYGGAWTTKVDWFFHYVKHR